MLMLCHIGVVSAGVYSSSSISEWGSETPFGSIASDPFGSSNGLSAAPLSSGWDYDQSNNDWLSSDGGSVSAYFIHDELQPRNGVFAARGSLDAWHIMNDVFDEQTSGKSFDAEQGGPNGPNHIIIFDPTNSGLGNEIGVLPVGDAVLPLLLMAMLYVVVKWRKRHQSSVEK